MASNIGMVSYAEEDVRASTGREAPLCAGYLNLHIQPLRTTSLQLSPENNRVRIKP